MLLFIGTMQGIQFTTRNPDLTTTLSMETEYLLLTKPTTQGSKASDTAPDDDDEDEDGEEEGRKSLQRVMVIVLSIGLGITLMAIIDLIGYGMNQGLLFKCMT